MPDVNPFSYELGFKLAAVATIDALRISAQLVWAVLVGVLGYWCCDHNLGCPFGGLEG